MTAVKPGGMRGLSGSKSTALTRTYRIWRGMHNRCYSRRNPAYARYGAAGIFVCAEWAEFKTFLADMGEAPSGMSLDRRDNNGPYCKANCRWATTAIQNQNRGGFNRRISHAGETHCASEWARRIGISRALLHWRLQNGWSVANALTRAPQ